MVERQRAERLGPGRPAIVNFTTPSGLELLRNGENSLFRRLTTETEVLWGPRRTFSHWNVPFFGGADIFAKVPVAAKPFELVLEPGSWLYRDAREEVEGRYASVEAFLAWAAKSGNPRYLGAAAVLLRDLKPNVNTLVRAAKAAGSANRLGYLATLAGMESVVEVWPRPRTAERMLDTSVPVSQATAKIAHRWRVRNPVSTSVVKGLMELYGNAG